MPSTRTSDISSEPTIPSHIAYPTASSLTHVGDARIDAARVPFTDSSIEPSFATVRSEENTEPSLLTVVTG